MKNLVFALLLLTSTFAANACPVCDKQQPALLKGITHGAGPQGNWDYVIIWVTVFIVAASFFFSVKWLIRPGEKGADHIKRIVLNHE